MINRLQNPFNAEVVSGVVDLLEDEGYMVSIVDTRDDPDRQQRQLEAFIRHGRGGILWVPAMETAPETLELLKAQRLPVVTFLRNIDAGFDHVGIRNTEATAVATTRLISLGHRQIAYLGGTEATMVRDERVAGYLNTCAEFNLGEGIVWECEDTRLAGLEAMTELMLAYPKTTAVVCNGDMVALGASLALTRMGRVVGRDVSVVGFDDIEDAAVATPALTTVSVHPKKLGRKLARVMLDRIEDPGLPPVRLDVSTELIERDTTGAA